MSTVTGATCDQVPGPRVLSSRAHRRRVGWNAGIRIIGGSTPSGPEQPRCPRPDQDRRWARPTGRPGAARVIREEIFVMDTPEDADPAEFSLVSGRQPGIRVVIGGWDAWQV